jgi:hypothetical protein
MTTMPIPKPTPLSTMPVPPIPPELIPKPMPLGVCVFADGDVAYLAVVLKRTYSFKHNTRATVHEKQLPLSLKNVLHDPLPKGQAGSYKEVPEIVGNRPGTDIIVRGHARPASPMTSMRVGVRVGSLNHEAEVIGDRTVDLVQGKLAFSPAKPFESMPLRWELSYGGEDQIYKADLGNQIAKHMTSEQLRRTFAFAQDLKKPIPPIAYPRNRVGSGYCLTTDMKLAAGRALPNIERANDRLTPERFICADPARWHAQPLSIGFDFMSVFEFPRTAMMGLPPICDAPLDSLAEVTKGFVPAGYCKGNFLTAEREAQPGLIHPLLGRCAPLGLRSETLMGDETITLTGMHPAHEQLAVVLPRQRVQFSIPVREKFIEAYGELAQVFIDVDQGLLTLIWIARTPFNKTLSTADNEKIIEMTKWRTLDDSGAGPQTSPISPGGRAAP